MSQLQVVVYPRGFAGFDIGLPIRIIKPSNAQIFKSIVHNNNFARENKVVISNTDVESLWNQLTNGDRFVSNASFREAILKAALIAFGTKDFREWVALQESNTYLTTTHNRFINDTFNFIKEGTRGLNIQMWMQLLAAEKTGDMASIKINTEKYFNTKSPIHMRESVSLKETIIKWVSMPNGFEDLLGTLHVLFGDSEIL